MQEHLKSFDFIRTLLAVGIICYHFSVRLSAQAVFRPFNEYGIGGSWGETINYMFFMLSGCLLYIHYRGRYSLKKYYWKRFRSIFPMFWIVFLHYYIQNVLGTGKVFYNGRPWTILLSVIGMDGYLVNLIPNYYILGEWFLGMIIMLYLIYPLIQKLTDCFPKATIVTLTVLFILTRNTPMIHPAPSDSIISCLFSFTLGIYDCKYSMYRKKKLNLAMLLIGIVLVIVPLNINENILNHMVSIALFAGLYEPGRILSKKDLAGCFWKFLGRLTYPVFLLQHVMILQIIHAFNPVSAVGIFFFLGVSIVYIFLVAWILKTVTDGVLHTKWFQKIENRVLTEKG